MAIAEASRWINRVASAGGVNAQSRKSFEVRNAKAGERIDIEIISGAAFVRGRAVPRAEDAGAQRNADYHSMNTLRKFELWESSTGHECFPAENDSARKLLDGDARLLTVLEASSWEEAQEIGRAHV